MKRKKEKQTKKGSTFTSVLLILIFLAGLSLVLYPTLANYVNQLHSSTAIADYTKAVGNIKDDEYERILEKARQYNEDLAHGAQNPNAIDEARYLSTLDVTGSGIMGYIEIPAIGVSLPIYHGTSEQVLQVGAGHIDWTSLPIGGESTHSALSGHRGLPSAKLFTGLDLLVVGDVFMVRVLNEVMTYEVDQILRVLPHETGALQISEGEDYCTLVTCTPYGINTHRYLVRGHRISNAEEAYSINIVAEAVQVTPIVVAAVISIPLLILILITVLISSSRRKRRMQVRRMLRKR